MSRSSVIAMAAAAACLLLAAPATATAQDVLPAGTQEQRDAMQALSWMDGEWVGEATIFMGPGAGAGHPHTERIGPILGGSIKVIEGRSAGSADGSPAFNAFAIVSWDDAADRYMMRSYANGHAGDFPLEATADGFSWTTPARGGEMRYVTTFKDGEWVEVGHFAMPGRDPMKVIELRLRRRGATDWPAGDPVIP
ncbi:DUF1579 domain-containing protein [Brevundimonas sp.]|uniref:DUF1579 domain-containing protein n=1 Tax=Brevundimonas sp. TaxID=1871086 RepID=UPI002D3785EA|nr:DUF1579 domain-containing protein [Brevundimonas sp.]HYC67512.1 DUF1579 domain-containing protein [Brevundimonas sp.]